MVKLPVKIKPHVVVKVILVCMIGALLSLIAHEAFHIILHWGNISHVSIFPNPGTIVQIETNLPPGYDIDGEEMVAYIISFIVIIFTALYVFKIMDDEDDRDPAQILFPNNPELQKLTPKELWEKSEMDIILPEKKSSKHSHKK
ncbi:hypothetical protein KC953_02695 [Candidatus Saccharibacteria bacterium]|nr:hypothetical protein [Candidatus Saccharibacteria bacterium]